MADFTTRLPRSLYFAEQVRQLDAIAIEAHGVSGFSLMQAAAAGAWTVLQDHWPQAQKLIVFTGSGNNGGDGYVIARLAAEAGLQVDIVQVGDPHSLKGAAAQAREQAQAAGVNILSLSVLADEGMPAGAHTVVVDALLGTGLDREVSGDYARAIATINSGSWPVLAVDIPSGLAANTGKCLGNTVRADVTVTFIGMKFGLLTGQARDYVGHVVFHSLDIPDQVYSGPDSPRPVAERIDINSVSRLLPRRQPASHKGDNGHVLVLGGDFDYGGAGIMAAEAAARAGAGLVSLITRSTHRVAALSRRPELMVTGTEDEGFNPGALLEKASVIVVGPGLGRSDWGRKLLQLALSQQRSGKVPLVIDADGLQLLAERGDVQVNMDRRNWLLTPHPGEAAALLDCDVAAIQADRHGAVQSLARRWGGVCLLKGSGSLIATGDSQTPVYLCTEGNPGMGSGGMGDVLSGIAAALVAQGLGLVEALCCAICVHGEAADQAAAAGGERGLLATDLLAFVHSLVNPPDSM